MNMKKGARKLLVNMIAVMLLFTVVPPAVAADAVLFDVDTLTITATSDTGTAVISLVYVSGVDDSSLAPEYGELDATGSAFKFSSPTSYDNFIDEYIGPGKNSIHVRVHINGEGQSLYLGPRFEAPEEGEVKLIAGVLSGLELDANYEYRLENSTDWKKFTANSSSFNIPEEYANSRIEYRLELRLQAQGQTTVKRPASDSLILTNWVSSERVCFDRKTLTFTGLQIGMMIEAYSPDTKLPTSYICDEANGTYVFGDNGLDWEDFMGTATSIRLYVYENDSATVTIPVYAPGGEVLVSQRDEATGKYYILLDPRREHILELNIWEEYISEFDHYEAMMGLGKLEYEYFLEYVDTGKKSSKWAKVSRDRNDKYGHEGEWKITRIIPTAKKGTVTVYIRVKLPKGTPKNAPPNEPFDKFTIMPRPVINVATGYKEDSGVVSAYVVNPANIPLQCADKPEPKEKVAWDEDEGEVTIDLYMPLPGERPLVYYVRTAPEESSGAWEVYTPASKVKSLRVMAQRKAPRLRVAKNGLRIARGYEYRLAPGIDFLPGGTSGSLLTGDQIDVAEVRVMGVFTKPKPTGKIPIPYMKTPPSLSWPPPPDDNNMPTL